MNWALPALGLGLVAFVLGRAKGQGTSPPPLGGGFVHSIPIPPLTIAAGEPLFVTVLDTTAMAPSGTVARALQDAGWEPSGGILAQGQLPPGNPFLSQGALWVVPVTRSGGTVRITSLPVVLTPTLLIINGNPTGTPVVPGTR